ncbi:hypothetical protein RFM26_11700 [Mesorhizobium sp. VK23B]|uniref:Uncharacterized protein n=1 Tax=Mesorhizobium dulcispinae TaxID=3072316 RepID=A0ABU4XBH9_9HYPH|nr:MULTISPECIES: hypothetical protein [unclassified Mesorhizobium]MDX8466346.1 hypothetical protein [Mesorhizobium sp. VK23B]MDX8472156.1 hypothetical protein [Mesorhizobium sp. VK23A]
MLPRTIFLGRLIGLFFILSALFMLMHKQSFVATVPRLIQDPPLVLFIGMIATVAGLGMVLGHNVWAGGILPVVVTLIGWTILIRGLLLLFLSPEALATYFEMFHFESLFYVYAAITLVLGLYLTYAASKALPPPNAGTKG